MSLNPVKKFYHTDVPEIVVRYLRNKETGKIFWRLYRRRNDGTNFVDKIEDRDELSQCQLCGRRLVTDGIRFCSSECTEEFMRREQIDAEENAWGGRWE